MYNYLAIQSEMLSNYHRLNQHKLHCNQVLIKLDNAVFYVSKGSEPDCICGQGCLGEAPKPDCVVYASQVVANACTLAKTLFENRIDVITVGTDTPLIDLRNFQLIWQLVSDALGASDLICKNNSALPFGVAVSFVLWLHRLRKSQPTFSLLPAATDKIAGWQVSSKVLTAWVINTV